MILEEERRKSKASLDEGGESSAAEDKDLNSSTEEITTGKVKELTKKFENHSAKESPLPLAQKREVGTPLPPTPAPQPQPLKSTRQRQLENLAKKAELSTRQPEPELVATQATPEQPEMIQKTTDDKPIEEEKEASPGTSSRSRSSSRSR